MSLPLDSSQAVVAEFEYVPAPTARTALGSLRECVSTWLLTRILTVGVGSGIALAVGKTATYPWRIWDGGWFVHIAQHGYRRGPALWDQAPAFYPLYPGMLRVAETLVGGNPVLGGVLLAFPLTLAAFLLLFILARDLVGEHHAAQRAVIYLALFPWAFFLQALYSEATFLVCALAAFVAAERKRFLAAGVATGLAMLARPSGVAVLAGVVVLALRHPQRRAQLLRVATAPVIFSVFPILLSLQGRSALAFLRAEHGWRTFSARDPVGTLLAPFHSGYDGARAAWTGAVAIADRLTSGWPDDVWALNNVTAFVVLVTFAALSIAAWKKLGSPYGVYCVVSLAIPLVARSRGGACPLLSLPRFALVLFPCFIVLGALPLSRFSHRAILGASSLCLVGLLYVWTQGAQWLI
jgi:hypothetical protein